MPTIHLKGPGLNNFFAEQLVNDLGPDEARKRSCGPMLASVERVIAQRKQAVLKAFDDLEHGDKRAHQEVRAEVERKARESI